MKNFSLVVLQLFAAAVPVKAQFTFATNAGAITIIAYTGAGGDVVIPATTNGYPVTIIAPDAFHVGNNNTINSVVIPGSVTNIGDRAFFLCDYMKTVTIPDGVTDIGTNAFADCFNLTSVTIPASVTGMGEGMFADCMGLTTATICNGVIGTGEFTGCTSLTSVTISNSVNSIGDSAFVDCESLISVTIPGSVTNIGNQAFLLCGLRSIAIPNSVISIGTNAFAYCGNLVSVTIGTGLIAIGDYAFAWCGTNRTGIYFHGNAPSDGLSVFEGDPAATVYYLPGTTGWSPTFGGLPTVLWNPLAQTGDGKFGVRNDQFGFTITGTANIPIVVEACTNLASAGWTPLQDCALTNGSIYFSDPQWTNYPSRFYRLRSP